MQQFDSKFRESREAALELDLFVSGVVLLIGALSFVAASALLSRKALYPIAHSARVTAVLGIIYSIIPEVLDTIAGSTLLALYWTWTVGFPIVSACLLFRTREAALSPAPLHKS